MVPALPSWVPRPVIGRVAAALALIILYATASFGRNAIADTAASPARYAWLAERTSDPAGSEAAGTTTPLRDRIAPPPGFERKAYGGMTEWLRGLPLLPGRPEVRLYDGSPKPNTEAHHAVIDIDVGRRDLQQCADAVMRLRAEFLFAVDCEEQIQFDFTSGDPASWSQWRSGQRPRVQGRNVRWEHSAQPDPSWRNFRRYLDVVFTYAGSYSLERELQAVPDPAAVLPGDVFIQGGFPGHAVLVVDMAENASGKRHFLLAQSYMPAQQIHILRNPKNPNSPWYPARTSGPLITPEWSFEYDDLHRFPDLDCSVVQ